MAIQPPPHFCLVGGKLVNGSSSGCPLLSFQRARPRLLCTNVQHGRGSGWGTAVVSTPEAASGRRKLASGQRHWRLPHWPLGEVRGQAARCQRSDSGNLNLIHPSLGGERWRLP